MLIPMYDNVIVVVMDEKEKISGGIIVTVNPLTTPYSTGKVVKVGHGYKVDGKLVPLQVKEGDIVLYRKGANLEIDDDGKSYQILSENTIFAIKR